MATQRNANRRRVSYKYRMVSDVLERAKEYAEKSQKILSEAVAPVPTYNGVVTDPKLIEFCKSVSKEVPGIRFASTHEHTSIRYEVHADGKSDCKYTYAVSAVGGYFDGDPYLSVTLAVHDGDYVIGSRAIRNNKFKCDTSDFYTANAKTLPSAIKAFKKHFRRISPEEIATLEYETVTTESMVYARDLMQQQNIALRALYEHSAFLQYMRSMARGDVPSEHSTQCIVAQAERYVQAVDAVLEVRDARHNMLYVQIGTVGGTTYSVVPYDKHTTPVTAARVVIGSEDKLEETFPGALGRVAVLAMTDATTFVSGVGMRTHENCFWVMR
jgi:hypothetical protein